MSGESDRLWCGTGALRREAGFLVLVAGCLVFEPDQTDVNYH